MDENLRLSAQNPNLGRRFTFQEDNDLKHMSKSVTVWLQKKDYISAMAFNPTWLEYYWKSKVKLESLNTSSVIKNPSGI